MSEIKILGPILLEGRVFAMNETGRLAELTFSFAPGREITPESIEEALRECAKTCEHQKFKLMGPRTFFNHVIIKEKTGRVGNFAVPEAFQFDAFGIETAEYERPERHDDLFDEDDEEEI